MSTAAIATKIVFVSRIWQKKNKEIPTLLLSLWYEKKVKFKKKCSPQTSQAKKKKNKKITLE